MPSLYVTVYVSTDELMEVDRLCDAAHLSRSSWCRTAIMTYAGQQRGRQLAIDPATQHPVSRVPIPTMDNPRAHLEHQHVDPFDPDNTHPDHYWNGREWVPK